VISMRTIPWGSQCDFENALRQSREESKPVLLDFHHPACAGCRQLDSETYSDPEVAETIGDNTLPVRIVTTEWDRVSTDIINCYISISTPTVQLLSAEGTVLHYWYGAPRQTVLSARQISDSPRRVFIESSSHLSPRLFLSQLLLGQGKAALRVGRFENAAQLFGRVLASCSPDDPAFAEAGYWRARACEGVTAPI